MAKSAKHHIGKSIRILRTLSGMSQEELADEIGKTRGMISYIEVSGNVNHYTLQDIAKSLNTTVDYIENYNPDLQKSTKTPNSLGTSGLEQEVIHLKNEIALLREVISNQKEMIEILKKSKQNL